MPRPLSLVLILALWTSLLSAIKYDGTSNSWAKYTKWNPCVDQDRAVLKFTFITTQENGLLFYMDDGGSNDYLLLKLVNGRPVIKYQLGTNSQATEFEKQDETVSDGEAHSITISRERMRFYLSIDNIKYSALQPANGGFDLCFGDCSSAGGSRNSPMYIGGVPSDFYGLTNLPSNFQGDIYDVEYKDCHCRFSNPAVLELGESVKATVASSDKCYNQTRDAGCLCKLDYAQQTCDCLLECDTVICGPVPIVEYHMTFEKQLGRNLVNNYGLDAKVFGDPTIRQVPMPHLNLSRIYAQLAGPSQRDECLGNLNKCQNDAGVPTGYTLSFWIAIENPGLDVNDGVLVSNGGLNSHGIAIYWDGTENNKLITKFKMPDGRTWMNEADGLWPAQVYHDGGYVNYWYHYAVTWLPPSLSNPSGGLTVYLNGIPTGINRQMYQEASADMSLARTMLQDGFLFLGPNPTNQIGISDVKFTARYMSPEEIMENGPVRHYYFNMNEVNGNRLVVYPRDVNAMVRGTISAQLVDGKAGNAIRLGRLPSDAATQFTSGDSHIDAGNITGTCFSEIASCENGLYTSFWVKFDQLRNGMVLMDTGPKGVTIMYRDNKLVAQLFTSRSPIELTYDQVHPNRWYFVELSYPTAGIPELYVDGQIVSSTSRKNTNRAVRHPGSTSSLLIGRRNDPNYQMTGAFTIDQLELLYGSRERLLDIGHIQRGVPPHAFYTMNENRNDQSQTFVDYTFESIQHDPRGILLGDYNFVPGKDANAVSLPNGGSSFQITNGRRNEECYSNLEKCVHGLLIRGWFNMKDLTESGKIMSTGVNGIDMQYKDGQLLVTADTQFRKWDATAPLAERQWQFLEVSFHPKFGLELYVDEEKIRSPTIGTSDKPYSGVSGSRFIIGGEASNDLISSSNSFPIVVDDLEIWYGDRDYVSSLCLITSCQNDNYIIDFDERDLSRVDGQYLLHNLLTIPYSGDLKPGLFKNALEVQQSQFAQIRDEKIKSVPIRETCIGNLALCSNGFSTKFYFAPDQLPNNGRMYLLSTGLNGIDVWYENGKLYAQATVDGKKWEVSSPEGYLKMNAWNLIMLAWSPVKGLLLARDYDDYVVDRDYYPEIISAQEAGNTGSLYGNSQFFIGSRNRQVPGAVMMTSGAFDDMYLYSSFLPGIFFGKTEMDTFSFERNLVGNVVEHPKFEIQLVNGARIVEAVVGNATQLDGERQYVDLGNHVENCFGDLELCETGATLSFRINPKNQGYRDGQVVMSGDAFDISINQRKLVARFMNADKEWRVSSYPLKFDEWQKIELSWTKDDGLEMLVDNEDDEINDRNGSPASRILTGGNVYVGRASSQGSRQYFNGQVDEIRFFQSPRDDLVKKGIIPANDCSYSSLIVTMDALSGNMIPNDNNREIRTRGSPQLVKGLTDNGILLEADDLINFGNGVSCQSRPNSCMNGFTLRFAIHPEEMRQGSYFISSNPVEVVYADGLLYVRYRHQIGIWSSSLAGLEERMWYTIDLSWDAENGMTVYVNNVQRAWQQKTNEAIRNYNQTAPFIIGAANFDDLSQRFSDFIIDDVQIWDAKRELLVACGLLPPPPVAEVHDAVYPPNGEGYIRLVYLPTEFDVNNIQWEELLVNFMTSNSDGLIWYNEDGNIKSYIYLKDGRLWFVTDDGINAPKKVQISSSNLSNNRDHEIKIRTTNGNQIDFYIDGVKVRSVVTDNRVRIVKENFSVGGHRDTAEITNGDVSTSLVGTISNVKISGDGHVDGGFDLFEEMWQDTFPTWIRAQCDMQFNPELVFLCDSGESPVTFLSNDAHITETSWELIGQKPSLEVRFTTVDPRGLLLYTGTKFGQFFALEIFDRKLYMVTDVGNGVKRTQVSGDDAADNVPHTAKFVFNSDENMINVFFDGERKPAQDVSLGGRLPSQILFNSPIYLGGLPASMWNNIPWNILSRKGFIGCVEELQINTLSSKLQDLARQQNARDVEAGCKFLPDNCSPNPCLNDGVCHNSYAGFYCDCAGLPYGNSDQTVCTDLTLIGTINGSTFYDFSLGRDIPTHVNDISAQFKTVAQDGTLWMTDSDSTTDYIKVYLENGELKTKVSINNIETVASVPGRFNDLEWHNVNLRRRADILEIWVDSQQPITVDLDRDNFYINMEKIRLGADAPNPGAPPYFFGHIRNVIIEKTPLVGEPFEGEKILNLNTVTFLTPPAHVTINNLPDELETNFKIVLNLKTKQEDALFMYQPGINSDYLAASLVQGKPVVRFNFAGRDEVIEIPKYVSDNQWHSIEIKRKDANTMSVLVDVESIKAEREITSRNLGQFDHDNLMYVGGIPEYVLLPNALLNDYAGGYRGCLSTFVKTTRLIDLTNPRYQPPEIISSQNVVAGCREPKVCDDADCLNGCECSIDGSICDNSALPWQGARCETPEIGYKFWENGNPGQVYYIYQQYPSPTQDSISLGFITCKPDGVLAKVRGSNDREFIRIYMDDGYVVADYQLGGAPEQIKTTQRYNNELVYSLQFKRMQGDATLKIYRGNQVVESRDGTVTGDVRLDGQQRFEVGSEQSNAGQYENGFQGIIFGARHNFVNIFNLAQDLNSQTFVKRPGTSSYSGDPATEFKCPVIEGATCGLPDLGQCQNFGVCENNKCNCTLTSYKGTYCTEEEEGIYFGWRRFDQGVYGYEYLPPFTTNEDYLALGFMTYEKDGTIFRVENADGTQYYDISMKDGYAHLKYNLNGEERIINETRKTLHSEESIYHIIRMNRTGSEIRFFVDGLSNVVQDPDIGGIRFHDQKWVMTGGRYYGGGPDSIRDDFNGIVAGINYNGKMIYLTPTSSEGTLIIEGDTKLADHPFKLKLPPPRTCTKCLNNGIMLQTNLCNCMYTGYTGDCCGDNNGLYGFWHKRDGGDSVIIYRNESIPRSRIDDLSVSFKTAEGWEDGEVVGVYNRDGTRYVIVEIVKDILQVRHNIGGVNMTKDFPTIDVRDQRNHTLRIHRDGNRGYVRLDDIEHTILFPGAEFFNAYEIYAGGAYDGKQVSRGHYGIIWGLQYNGIDIVENTRNPPSTGVELVTTGQNNFKIIPTPWPELCAKGSSDPKCNVVTVVPTSAGGAGGIIPNLGGGGGGGNTGAQIVPPATPPVSTGAIIGAVMGGLLMTSAIIWAASGMKPGFFTLASRFVGGKAGKGAYVPVSGGGGKPFPVSNGGGNYIGTVGMEDLGAAGSQAGSRRSHYEESLTQESRFDGADGGMNGSAINGMGGGSAVGYNAYNTTNSYYTRNETLENQQNGYNMNGGQGTMGAMSGYGTGMRSGYAGSVAGGSVSGSVYGFGTVTNPDQAFITLSEDIAVDNVVLTADGRYVVTGSNLGPPQVWNTTNGEMVTTMRGDFMGSTGLHLAANEQYLVGETMAEQAAVDMNDIQTGNHIPIRRVAVWDFNTGNPLPIAVDQLCTASCVSNDGYKVVMAMTDKFGGGTTVRVLDLLSNKILHELTYPETIGVADSASCVFISPDDRFVAVGFTNSFDNNANFIIFDLQSQSDVIDSPIVALNADPHCTVILNHDEALTGTRNGELVIWSMKTGKAQRQLTSGDAVMLTHGGMPAAHDLEVKEVALSEDGRYLASASADRTVKVWNMESESLMHTLHGHNDEVWTVDIASDSTIIVSGSQDGTIKLWRLRNGNQITSFNATMDIFHARFSKDKKTVVALGDKYGARKLIMLQIVSQKKWRMRSS